MASPFTLEEKQALLETEKLIEAQIEFKKAIKINPAFLNAYFNTGVISIKLGNLRDAKIAFEKAIEINHSFANAHLNLGIVLLNLGELEEAEFSLLKSRIVIFRR